MKAAFAAFAGPDLVRVKWPNDVLIAGRKASGILIESGQLPGGRLWAAVGTGLNLVSAPAGLERPATCLARHLSEGVAVPSPHAVLERLDAALRAEARRYDAEGPGGILAAFAAEAVGLFGPIQARLAGETLDGEAEGLDPDGALRLRLPGGELRRITAGEVFFPASPQGAD